MTEIGDLTDSATLDGSELTGHIGGSARNFPIALLDARFYSTAAALLTAIKTVDGAGSGLDADLLDGMSSAAFAAASDLSAHLSDTSDAHDASAISVADAGGNYTATEVEAALAEVMDALQAHEADSSGAHAATAISNAPAGNIVATTVQAAIDELDSEKAAASHSHAASDIASGTLAHERGGLEADVSAYTGFPYISAGATSQVAAGISNGNVLLARNTANSGEVARFTTDGIEGRTASEFKSDLDLESGTDFLSPAAIAAAYQPLDTDLTTIAGLTATTNNIIQSVSSAWASRTPTQVTATLDAMVGDSGSGGTKGLAPAPASGDAAAGKFLKADGTWAAPSGGSFTAATQAEMEAASSTTVGVTPGRQHFHPGHPKCWARAAGAGTLTESYNISSVDDDGTGDIGINIGTDFSTATWAPIVGGVGTVADLSTEDDLPIFSINAIDAGLIDFQHSHYSAGSAIVNETDPTSYAFAGFGDHA